MTERRPWYLVLKESFVFALTALRFWTRRQVVAAIVSSIAVAVVLGVATVLIPNTIFVRDIPPVWWNYPVWIITSVMTGMLIATYVRPRARTGSAVVSPTASATAPDAASDSTTREERRTGRFAIAGGMLAWFAVGCPVCNKIALLALGYTGALTWFAPFQPVLAIAALVFSTVALVWRLRGQIACPVPEKAGSDTMVTV